MNIKYAKQYKNMDQLQVLGRLQNQEYQHTLGTQYWNLCIIIQNSKITDYCVEQKSEVVESVPLANAFVIIYLVNINKYWGKNLIQDVKIANAIDLILYHLGQKNVECIGYHEEKTLTFLHEDHPVNVIMDAKIIFQIIHQDARTDLILILLVQHVTEDGNCMKLFLKMSQREKLQDYLPLSTTPDIQVHLFLELKYQQMPQKLQQGLVENDKPFPKYSVRTNKQQQYTTAYTRPNQQQQKAIQQQQQQNNKLVQKKK
ncbi:unnamed protein product [Paramecium octaurelia]|uniref:Uncharacterized protein n=1 Tax=Paramecium octaurelia TaxID=43137 RepID=A0A8S1SNQ2_PAROT|nr:unnamed protein product [Paramecium octaurelia]